MRADEIQAVAEESARRASDRAALDARILQLHREELSNGVIARRLNVTKERVREVLRAAGLKKHPGHEGIHQVGKGGRRR